MIKKKIELLSPAGDLERLKVSLLYGADAVYFGGKEYSLRANANNFSLDEIEEASQFAHSLGKRVYLTLNIVFHNEDIDGVFDYIKEVVKRGIDAFIVSDPFLISYIKEHYPQVEVHLSTQNSTSNILACQYFKDQGVDRVVLARELSKYEMKEIIDQVGVDIEVFIHGAMCTCYSGRCTLSNYVTNRDSNRGGCSQVCRFSFATKQDDKMFTMATKDLNMTHYIKDLLEIGVTSLKVEGRMRSLYYLATVIGTYRALIDRLIEGTVDDSFLENCDAVLSRVANRETSTHYFLKKADHFDQYYTGRQEISNQDFLGIVLSYDKMRKEIILTERNYFEKGDQVELFTPKGEHYFFTIDLIYNEKLELVRVANHPEEVLRIPFDMEVEPYSMMRVVKGAKSCE